MGIDWMSFIKNERYLENNIQYRKLAEPWQFAIDQALLSNDKVYVEFPRGHDKTGRLACHALCWLLDGENKIGYAAGVDKDNAKLFRDEMKAQSRRNSKFFGVIEFYNYVVENPKNNNQLVILASDAPSNIGLKFNLLLINDFVDWKDQDFFEVLLSATGKFPGVKIWVESNAGRVKRGYKWNFREYARESSQWFFRTTKKWLPSWTAKEWFEEQRHILLPATYRRLIGNEWIEDADSFLTIDQVNGITMPYLPYLVKPDPIEFVATGCDLGQTKAAAVVATVGSDKDANKPFRLLDITVFPGSRDNPPLIRDVESAIESHMKRFQSNAIVIDPWQMRKTIQDHEVDWPIEEYTFTPASVMHLTSEVFRNVVNKHLEIYPSAGPAVQANELWDLQRELSDAIIRQMGYGERIDHRRSGYTDRITAVGMTLWWLSRNTLPTASREFDVKII